MTANIADFNLTFGTIEPIPFPQGDYGNCTMFTKMGLNFQNKRAMLARWPNLDNETARYRWQYLESQPKTTDSFRVTEPDLVARMVKWSAEPDPWMHLFQKVRLRPSSKVVPVKSDKSQPLIGLVGRCISFVHVRSLTGTTLGTMLASRPADKPRTCGLRIALWIRWRAGCGTGKATRSCMALSCVSQPGLRSPLHPRSLWSSATQRTRHSSGRSQAVHTTIPSRC